MNNENFHPVQNVPPIAHALHKWDEERKILKYEYNGTDIITMQIKKSDDVGFRHGSDGTMQSIAFVQQIYIPWKVTTFSFLNNSISRYRNNINKLFANIGTI